MVAVQGRQQGVAALLALLLLLVSVMMRPGHAAAHAVLAQSDPPAQAVLARVPARVQLSFTEAVEPSSVEVTVLDAQRQPVDQGDARLLPGVNDAVAISLRDGLGPGVYTVQWKVVSAVDGHETRNLLPFTVGDPGSVPATAVDTSGFTSGASSGGLPGVLARWLTVLAAVVLTGAFIFVPLMLVPALRRLDGSPTRRREPTAVPSEVVEAVGSDAARRWLRIAWGVLALFTVAAVVLLLVETATAVDGGLQEVLGRPLWDRLTGTRRGTLWLARAGLLGLIAAGLAVVTQDICVRGRRALERRWTWSGLAALSAGTLLVQALGSHSAALRSQESLATAIDFVHLLAVAVWIGGLVQFGLALLPALRPLGGPPRTWLLAGLIPRFSVLAGLSVGVVVLTGLYQTVRLLGGWSAFTEVAWGQALLVKLLLLVPLLLLAAFNLLVVSPWMRRLATRMDQGARERAARLRLHFRRALLGEVGVAVLILLVVGVLTGQAPRQATGFTAAGPFRPIILDVSAEDLTGRLVLSPGRIGLNRFDISATTKDGKPVPDGTEMVLRFATLDQDTGVTEARTEALGGGRFTATGSYLSTVGLWEVAALVRRPQADEVKLPFQFSMTGQTGQVLQRENRPAAPLERGRELYQQNCAQCHGAGARGDGPLAPGLNPRPFDLTVHVPLHTDQEVHDWIADGIPRTAMPAWKDQFSEEEIQAIINYLRQVAEQTKQDR